MKDAEYSVIADRINSSNDKEPIDLSKWFLNQNKHVRDANVESLCKEIEELHVNNPILFAKGTDVFDILNEYLDKKFGLIKLTHYAWQNSKENYRIRIMSELNNNDFI